jgi:V8-like Glu-specific endopeptidase
MNTYRRFSCLFLLLPFIIASLPGCGSSQNSLTDYEQSRMAALETVKAGTFDGGRMWTFDNPPVDYINKTYGFNANQTWLDDVRMSALRYDGGCSASFVSGDGLVMTNHHCVRRNVEQVQKNGEKLLDEGFFAKTLEEERKVPGLYVDQLVELRDVTAEIQAAMDKAPGDEAKVVARRKAVDEIQTRLSAETKLRCNVVTLYNGGKYSAYIYKRYTDCRLVFAPQIQIAHFGGEYDNFTFPRYAFDCSFVRVYDDNGKPLKTGHHFTWSKGGAKPGEAVFVVGNPGRTSRLNTADQLAYNRDVYYPYVSRSLDDRVELLSKYSKTHPDKKDALRTQILGVANSQKAYKGQLTGLRDEVLMQRRRDFDKQFRAAVEARPELKSKYGRIWDDIASTRATMRTIAPDLYALRPNGIVASEYLARAVALVRYAANMSRDETSRDTSFVGASLNVNKKLLAKAMTSDADLELMTLQKQFETMQRMLKPGDPVLALIAKDGDAGQASASFVRRTVLTNTAKLEALVNAPATIEHSDDPYIALARMMYPRYEKAAAVNQELTARDQVNISMLGRALFDVYGTSIPPDATFTLRISDGVVEGYPYNGTMAPPFTTFYGLYDRYNSFKGEEAWELPDAWKNPPQDFNLGTPYNVVTTNDIIGGNSGSPMINKNKEVVGLVFDGNIESLPGDYIFAEDAGNRTVAVHSAGILEAIKHIYRADRLATELETGRMTVETGSLSK